MPFMERFEEHYGFYPREPVADAGYGGYDNYMYNLQRGIDLVQKYNYFGKEKDPKFRKKIFNIENWKKNEEGYRICPDGRVFDVYIKDVYDQPGKSLQICQLYREANKCEGCPFRNECLKNKDGHKTISRNVVLEEFRKKVDENLTSESGKQLCQNRSVQAEGSFGSIKQNALFTRFTRKGMKNVEMEFLLVCLGLNFRRYHKFRTDSKPKEESLLS